MSKFSASESFHHSKPARTAILLVQLGTPDEPTTSAVKRYLREFLSDPRVVDIPALIWKIILYGYILNVRPKKSAQKYASIWTKEGSPLRVYSERQCKLLRGHLGEQGLDVDVVLAMRYGEPSVSKTLKALREQGMERLLVVPMYPQYAAATSATAFDAVFRELSLWRNMPEIRTVKHFHDHPKYIQALAQHVQRVWQKEGKPEHFLMSFHGVPKRSLTLGDPYHCECLKTGRLLAQALGLTKEQYSVSFQSRFGRAEWLQPYTTATLKNLATKVKGRLDVFCPGFIVDCLETLEEIALEGKDDFLEAGGSQYNYIPCLNDTEPLIQALSSITREHLSGWSVQRLDGDALHRQQTELATVKAMAAELGADR